MMYMSHGSEIPEGNMLSVGSDIAYVSAQTKGLGCEAF